MINPLYWLDLRVRVRERRLWVITLLFIFVPLAISSLAVAVSTSSSTPNKSPGQTAMVILSSAMFCHLGLIVLLSPLVSAQRISQEREQRTYAALINSPLTPHRIVFGKLLGAWTFLLWISILSLPFAVLSWLWGGIGLGTILAFMVLNTLAGMTLVSISLGFSGLFGRSMSAYITSAIVLFLWCIALPIAGMFLGKIVDGSAPPQWVFYLFFLHNPAAPQIWLMLHASGDVVAYTGTGIIGAIYGVGCWIVFSLIGYGLAVHGVKREVC